MPIAGSIFLIAVGAILKFATNIHVKGLSIDAIGVILMIAGVAALVLSLLQEAIWSRRTRAGEAPAVEERREVREPPRY
jgi:TRAP-type C4-dicarboxylate transport system permease small subunit